MPRIRTIKPDFWKHEVLSELPEATHLLAAALLNYADDEGYFNANPALIKAECSPLREPSVSIQESLTHLSSVGYIRVGTAEDGRRYGKIVKFADHQRVNRPTGSKIKELNIAWGDSLRTHGTITEDSPPEGKGKEGKGKDTCAAEAPRKARRQDHVFEALAEACGLDWKALPQTARGSLNKAAKELRDIDATPDQIHARARAYRQRWPGIDLTPMALVKNWGQVSAQQPSSAPRLLTDA